jgi:hypothetical protein
MGSSVGFVRNGCCENSAPVEGEVFYKLNDKISKKNISANVVTFSSVNPIPSVTSYTCLAKE